VGRHALSSSIDDLVAGASAREPMQSTDSKSGARFERIVLDGESYVLKQVDTSCDWIARQVGDIGCWPVVVWERGLVDLAPACIDHAIVGAARVGRTGAVLMHDVSPWLVANDDRPLPLDQHLRFLDHLAQLHAATWGWRDAVGLCPLANRYAFFGPAAIECEAALGFPEPVPRLAREGWRRLEERAPDVSRALAPLRGAPWILAGALASTPRAFLHGDSKVANLGTLPDGRTVLIDWSLCGEGPPLAELAHYIGLNTRRLPVGHTKDDAITAYRQALERAGVSTDGWWDRQLRLCLLGLMVQLAWEKAFDDTGEELAWWSARVPEGLAELDRA
jgi:aminoglycoside phosphotransferase (APT) family kinase protein